MAQTKILSKNRLSKAALLISLASLGACSSTPNDDAASSALTTQQGISATSLEQVTYSPLALPVEFDFEINNESQNLVLDGFTSKIAAFELPADQGQLQISLESYADKTLYPASIKVMNQDGKVLAQKDFSEAEYDPAYMAKQDSFDLSVNVIPSYTDETLKLLIYTKKDDQYGLSTVMHPAKIFAINKGTVPPNIKDPQIAHAQSGKLSLEIQSSYSNSQISYASQSSGAKTNVYAPALEETQSYYLDSIEKSVAAGDLDKAMKLMDEAQRLGVKNARQTFIKAVKAQQ